MVILHVVGARPNFMKVAPVMAAIKRHEGVRQVLVHTGQHYDANMSEVFFTQLGIPKPDVNLEVGPGSHAQQTANIMTKIEPVLGERKPNWVMVYGDVNSTLAASLVCAKSNIPMAHVEAGLRSFDRHMPEEINRLVTDQLADLLFTPSAEADENLKREGIPAVKIHLVGNVMIDTLIRLLPAAKVAAPFQRFKPYALVTLHRPSNVDDPERLKRIAEELAGISRGLTVLFPIHPRTRQRLKDANLKLPDDGKLQLLDPLGYQEFLGAQYQAAMVITDSGGIQEECSFLGVPCLTLRENTERPVTVTIGTNVIVGNDMNRLREEVERIMSGKAKKGSIPPLWDGKASERIAGIIAGL
ncbi:MAG TPA: UDP-N-acetylglucosamine 2-epimerase (non-hydrolyzing) [Terriglobia bacterium]|nr:UDP-N-acetylglucosamine 2-epimerase (non-hydrolyzing) [Terriglobia bacterium]